MISDSSPKLSEDIPFHRGHVSPGESDEENRDGLFPIGTGRCGAKHNAIPKSNQSHLFFGYLKNVLCILSEFSLRRSKYP